MPGKQERGLHVIVSVKGGLYAGYNFQVSRENFHIGFINMYFKDRVSTHFNLQTTYAAMWLSLILS